MTSTADSVLLTIDADSAESRLSRPPPPPMQAYSAAVSKTASVVMANGRWQRKTNSITGRRSSDVSMYPRAGARAVRGVGIDLMAAPNRTTARAETELEIIPETDEQTDVSQPIKDEANYSHRAHRSQKYKRVIFGSILIAQLIIAWYALAIFFPQGARQTLPVPFLQELLWTDGALQQWVVNGTYIDLVCPKESLCSQGWGEILLLVLSRLTAFMMYVTIGLIFLTKCHAVTHFLARTYVAELVPLEYLHPTHKSQGLLFLALAILHTIGHLIRWGLRGELGEMLSRSVGVSGLVALVVLLVCALPMALQCLKNRIGFETRIWLHAGRTIEILLLLSMLAHATRAFAILAVFLGLWLLDQCYMLLYRTYRLEMVELTRLEEDEAAAGGGEHDDGEAVGLQMLWRNPPGFEPTSGEFILVQFPWLPNGGDEWHPFSIYLREATAEGLSIATSEATSPALVGGGRRRTLKQRPNGGSITRQYIEEAIRTSKRATSVASRPSNRATSLARPSNRSQDDNERDELVVDDEDDRSEMVREQLHRLIEQLNSAELSNEVRDGDTEADSYDTTQVFIMPVGDWTKEVCAAVRDQKLRRHRACWIRGPYTSPFSIASDFSQLVLFASGIGITPSLGVLANYRGVKRVAFLVWCTRSPTMLKFFAPLIADAQLATVYYTGKRPLTEQEIANITASGRNHVIVYQKRPDLRECFARTLISFESIAAERASMDNQTRAALQERRTSIESKELSREEVDASVKQIDASIRASWCGLYCGGSHTIKHLLKMAARDWGVGWQAELFDW